MPMKLEDIEPGEISLVDVPANKRKFLFKKADLEGSSMIIPNGILVCPYCGHQEALIDFVKSASELCPKCGADLLSSDTEIIFKRRRRNMKVSLKELIEKLFEDAEGEEEELTEEELEQIEKAENKIPKDALNAVKGAVKLLTKYKGVLPDDVQAAIKTLAKVAAYGYGYPAKKKGDEDEEDEELLEKAGAKLSKDTVGRLKKIYGLMEKVPEAVKLLKALIPSESKKSEEVLAETLVEKMNELIKAVKGEDEEEDESGEKDALKKQLEKLQNTIKKIAEAKGLSKLLKGQDDEEEEEEEEPEEEEEKDDKGSKKKTKKTAHKWSFTLTPPPVKKD